MSTDQLQNEWHSLSHCLVCISDPNNSRMTMQLADDVSTSKEKSRKLNDEHDSALGSITLF